MEYKVGDCVEFCVSKFCAPTKGKVVSFCNTEDGNVCAVVSLDTQSQGYLHNAQGETIGYISHVLVDLDTLKENAF